MRRLNLLRQIMQTAAIGSGLGISPAARLLGITLQLINSRRGWREWITISERDLLDECGFADSVHSRRKLKNAIAELTAAGIVDVKLNGQRRCTQYRLVDLSANHVNVNVKKNVVSYADRDAEQDAARDAERDADRGEDRRADAAPATGNMGNMGNDVNIGKEVIIDDCF